MNVVLVVVHFERRFRRLDHAPDDDRGELDRIAFAVVHLRLLLQYFRGSVRFFREGGFLTPDECLAIRRGMDRGKVERAEVLAGGIRPDFQARLASLVEPPPDLVTDIEAKLDACRGQVAQALGVSLGEREGPGFIRYPAGGFYRAHRDRGDDPHWEPAARRAVALVLFLNASRASGFEGDFDGGILRLYSTRGSMDVVPEAGLLVAFSADVLHEVTEVRDGTRDTIVDWYYDPGR